MKTRRNVSTVCMILVFGLVIMGCGIPFFTPEPTPTSTSTPTNTPEPTPTLTPTPNPVVLSQGTIDIPQTYMADLDTGIVPTGYKDSASGNVDLWFESVGPQDRFLESYNGASWAVVGTSAVSYDQCKTIPPTAQRVDIKTLPVGTYICVTTNIGNISIVRINAINTAYVGSIRIDYTTWHQP